jgi:hypothetical protein
VHMQRLLVHEVLGLQACSCTHGMHYTSGCIRVGLVLMQAGSIKRPGGGLPGVGMGNRQPKPSWNSR